jgi:hypothetical protein
MTCASNEHIRDWHIPKFSLIDKIIQLQLVEGEWFIR